MQSRSLIAAAIAMAVVSAPVSARPATDSAPPAARIALNLNYAAYAAGLNVLQFRTSLEMDARAYRIEVDYHTAGLFGALFHSEMQNIVAGLWEPQGVAPSRFYAYGTLRGVPRRTQIDYDDGQPVVKILQPAADGERDPVPPEMQRNTIDTLSAMALLVHQVAQTGHCNGSVTTFDGRRVSTITVHDAGEETLSGGGTYRGPAHRCDFEGRQIAGFVHDVDRAELQRPQRGSAWLAPVAPGTAPLPVRVSFHTRFFGDAVLYLTHVEPAASAAAAAGVAAQSEPARR